MNSESNVLEICKWKIKKNKKFFTGTMLGLENEQIVNKDLELIFLAYSIVILHL